MSAVPVEEAQALISRALTADENGLRKEALDLYMKAAEFCLEHVCTTDKIIIVKIKSFRATKNLTVKMVQK